MRAYRPSNSPSPRIHLAALVVLSSLAMAGAAGAGAPQTAVVVAQEGERAPDDSGDLSDLGNPIIQRQGEIVFTSSIRDSGFLVGSGVFRAGPGPGSSELIVAEGQPSPDGNGNFGPFNPDMRYVNAAGEVAFDHFLESSLGGILDGWTIFVGRGGAQPLRIVARANQLVPASGGDRFGFTLIPLGLNNRGQVAFSNVTRIGELLGIWRGDGTPASLTKIVVEGDPTPAGDGILAGGLPLFPVMNDAGQVAFHDTALVGNEFLGGIYRSSGPGTIVRIARQDDPVPSGDGDFGFFLGIGFQSTLSINASGAVSFGAQLINTSGGFTDDAGLFLGNGSSTIELVRKGDPVPDGNGIFLDFLSPAQYILNDRGQVLFQARLSGAAGGASEGVFVASASGIKQIARLAQPAPGGGVFSSFTAVMALNNLGHAMFFAFVDAGGFGTDRGLFYYDGRLLRQVVREGDSLAGFGTVTNLGPRTGVEGESRPERSQLNDFGQVTYDFFATQGSGVVIDSFAFVFADGFESGNVSSWSATVP